VKLTGISAARSFGGNVENGSRFDNLQIIGYNPRLGIDLPRGMYTACRFEAGAGEGSGAVSVNKAGSFSFDGCTFEGGANVFRADHPEADVTINGSTFGLVEAQTYSLGIIQIQSADEFVFTDNTVDVRGLGGKDVQLLTIGRTGWQSK